MEEETLTSKVLKNIDLIKMISADTKIIERESSDNVMCCCPIHGESRPSMSISKSKQVFNCKSCGAAGNAIHYYAAMKKMEYRDALIELGRKYGVIGKKDSKENDFMQEMAEIYMAKLKKSAAAMNYLRSRKLTDETIREFGLGYATGNEFTVQSIYETMKKANLIRTSENGYQYSFFSKRIIFPIRSVYGRVHGFGGRDITGLAKAKYINSPESEYFKKSNILYGLDKSIEEIRKKREAIVVEGYMDVITLYQEGIKNVCSPMGVSLGKTQANELFRNADSIVLCLDGDKAGVNGMMRMISSIAPLMRDGKNIRIALMPEGYDPDVFVLERGREAFEKLIDDAKLCSDFIMEKMVGDYDMSVAEDRCRFNMKMKEIAEKFVNAPIFRNVFEEQMKIYSLSQAMLETARKHGIEPEKMDQIRRQMRMR